MGILVYKWSIQIKKKSAVYVPSKLFCVLLLFQETKRRLSEKSAEELLDVKSTTGDAPKKQETEETRENECIPVNTKVIPETPKKLLKKKSKDLIDNEEFKKVLKQPSIDEMKVLEDKSQEIETQPLPPKEEEQFKIPEPASEEKEFIPESTTEIKKTPEHFDETLKSVEETKPVESSEPVQEAIIESESPAVLPETLETNVELESKEKPTVQKVISISMCFIVSRTYGCDPFITFYQIHHQNGINGNNLVL